MTNFNYPERWLNDRRIRGLTDTGHRFFVLAMTYSVANLTDGYLSADDITDLVESQRLDLKTLDELEAQKLTEPASAGKIYLVDFESTQTSAASMRAAAFARSKKNQTQNLKRLDDMQRAAHAAPSPVETGETLGQTNTATAHPSAARIGEAKSKHAFTKQEAPPVTSWPVAEIPKDDDSQRAYDDDKWTDPADWADMNGEIFTLDPSPDASTGSNGAYSR